MLNVESQFIGLSKKHAQDLAEAKNMLFRLIRSDDEDFFSYPMDERQDRICVELDSGLVSRARVL